MDPHKKSPSIFISHNKIGGECGGQTDSSTNYLWKYINIEVVFLFEEQKSNEWPQFTAFAISLRTELNYYL